jgi:hypothetical protein
MLLLQLQIVEGFPATFCFKQQPAAALVSVATAMLCACSGGFCERHAAVSFSKFRWSCYSSFLLVAPTNM